MACFDVIISSQVIRAQHFYNSYLLHTYIFLSQGNLRQLNNFMAFLPSEGGGTPCMYSMFWIFKPYKSFCV